MTTNFSVFNDYLTMLPLPSLVSVQLEVLYCLDFADAFNSVSHDLPIATLKKYAFQSTSCDANKVLNVISGPVCILTPAGITSSIEVAMPPVIIHNN